MYPPPIPIHNTINTPCIQGTHIDAHHTHIYAPHIPSHILTHTHKEYPFIPEDLQLSILNNTINKFEGYR